MRAFAKTLPADKMRSAPMPLTCPLNIVEEMSRVVDVPRGATLSCETFDAVDPMFPCGKNWMKMSAVDDAATDPIGELLKMLRSVMKFVPFKPRTEPTTGMKISFVTASGPAMAPF